MTAALIGGAAWVMTHPTLVIGERLYDKPPNYEELATEVSIPDDLKDLAEYWAGQYNLSPELVEAIMYRETRFKTDAVNGSNLGVCQINQRWQQDRMNELGVNNLCDPSQNIHVCCDILAEKFEEYEDPAAVLAFYRWGNAAARDTLENGVFYEYAENVLQIAKKYELEHGK